MVRRLVTVSQLTLSAIGKLALGTLTSASVTSASDWSQAAGLYLNYRVRQLKLKLIPVQTASNAATTYMPPIAIARWYGASQASTFNQLVNEPGSLVESSLEKIAYETNYLGFPDGQLWTPTNATIAGGNAFGFVYMTDPAIVGINGSILYDAIIEYLTEFTNAW